MEPTKALLSSLNTKCLRTRPGRRRKRLVLNEYATNWLAIHLNQWIGHCKVGQVAAMRTPMLPLVDVARSNWPPANEPVNTSFTLITDVLDLNSWDVSADSGHALIIRETNRRLNPKD